MLNWSKNHSVAFTLWTLVLILGACSKKDTTPPVVVVLEPEYRVPLGGVYMEQGALGTDKEDGVLDTALISIDASAFRNDSVGFYAIHYYIADAAGNEDSATRNLAVYARTANYLGSWTVTDSCDTLLAAYTVNALADPLDSTRVLLDNFRHRGSGYTVGVEILGKLGNVIQLNDTLPDFTYSGSAVLLYGRLDGFAFDLLLDEVDSLSFNSCVSRYRKP